MRPFATFDKRFDARDTDAGGNVHHGRKASMGNLPGKGGDIHGVVRSSANKHRTRTLFNKRARAALNRDLISRITD